MQIDDARLGFQGGDRLDHRIIAQLGDQDVGLRLAPDPQEGEDRARAVGRKVGEAVCRGMVEQLLERQGRALAILGQAAIAACLGGLEGDLLGGDFGEEHPLGLATDHDLGRRVLAGIADILAQGLLGIERQVAQLDELLDQIARFAREFH